MLKIAENWLKINNSKLIEISSEGEIDYFPSDGDDSISFGFEAARFVYQVVIWDNGHINFLSLNKNSLKEKVENSRVNDEELLSRWLDSFISKAFFDNKSHKT